MRPGTLAYWSTECEWVISNPDDPFYATAIMAAEYHWIEDQGNVAGHWAPLYIDGDSHAAD